MSKDELKSVFFKTLVVTAVLLAVSVGVSSAVVTNNAGRESSQLLIQNGLTVFQCIAGAIVTVFGFGCIFACLSPTLPPTTFARAMILTLLGLSLFSLSPWFAIAGSIVFAANCLATRLQVDVKQEG